MQLLAHWPAAWVSNQEEKTKEYFTKYLYFYMYFSELVCDFTSFLNVFNAMLNAEI